jgi:hypothetical protein
VLQRWRQFLPLRFGSLFKEQVRERKESLLEKNAVVLERFNCWILGLTLKREANALAPSIPIPFPVGSHLAQRKKT